VTYTLPSGVSGFTLKGQWHMLSRHVFRDLLSQVFQSKSRNTWRESIYHLYFKGNPGAHDGGVYITGLSK
jgi:hypothetical protein